MVPVSYIISVITSQKDVQVFLAILNIAGWGQAFCSLSNGTVNKDLWIIAKGKKNRKEVITQLQTVPGVRNISVVALSSPVTKRELAEVRELFAGVGLDASSITDDEIALFINAKLQGQYSYFIDYGLQEIERGPARIRIMPIEEHPHFSPDWLKKSNYMEEEMPGREFTIDDIEIRSVVDTIEREDSEPSSPPPNDQ